MTYEKAAEALVAAGLLDQDKVTAATSVLTGPSVAFTYPAWADALAKAGAESTVQGGFPMNDTGSSSKSQHRPQVGFWIAMFRGLLAITLGLVLLFNPDKTRVMLFNFAGFYWLLGGIALVRRTHSLFGKDTERVFGLRLSRVMGLVGILVGLLVVTRSLTSRWFDEAVLFELLGAVILLTGVLHLLGEFRIGRVIKLRRTTAQKVMAIFEIVLGALLIISPLERSPIIYWAAAIWALIGGAMILGDALTTRARARRQEPQARQPVPETDGE